MTDHLPECADAMIPDFHNERWVCICAALRACEQRVNGHRLSYENGVEVGYNKGYVAGLDAAREAVERVSTLFEPLGPALAAIDALRGES